jgi:hypothetical protein
MPLFIPISKVDIAQRTVYGVLSQETPDKSGEILDYATAKPAFQTWSDEQSKASNGKSLGNVRAMHGKIAAGKLTDLSFDDDNKRIEGCAKIVDDAEWEKVMEGVYTGFSIGGGYAKRWTDPNDPVGTKRFTPTLTEVSIVDNPCVPTATFEGIKADGSSELRKFHHQSHEDSMNPTTGSDAAMQDAVGIELNKAEGPALAENGKPVEPNAAPESRWLSKAAVDALKSAGLWESDALMKKEDTRKRNLELEYADKASPALSKLDQALAKAEDDEDKEGDDEDTKKAKKARRDEKAAKKAADEKEVADKTANDDAEKAAADDLAKKEYSDKEREKMADKGQAMGDGSFPIANKADLENAIKAFGRAKDKDAAKKHIIERAKALKATDALPADWEGSTKKDDAEKAATGKLAKGMHDVAPTACIIDELNWLANGVKTEEALEGDSASTSPKDIESIIGQLCTYLKARVTEETEELIADHDDDDETLEMSAHVSGLVKFVRTSAEPLIKSDSKAESAKGEKLSKFADALEKAGARHSKADTARLQSQPSKRPNPGRRRSMSLAETLMRCLRASSAALRPGSRR